MFLLLSCSYIHLLFPPCGSLWTQNPCDIERHLLLLSVWWAYDNIYFLPENAFIFSTHSVCVCCGGGVVWRPLSYRAPLTHPDTKRLDHIHDPSVWENATLPPWPLELKSFLLPPPPISRFASSASLSLAVSFSTRKSALLSLWKFNHGAHRCL